MDFVVSVKHLPSHGETVLGKDFQMIPGGKGANQACAAARMAGDATRVRMIGRIGHDVFGDHLKASLSAAGVDVSAVTQSRSQATGVALIAVESSGQNTIVVASGANMDMAATDIEAVRRVFRGNAVALFQLETPVETVKAALTIAREEGLITILDPAPAQPVSDDLLARVDILTPNETEALGLLGRAGGGLSPRLTLGDAAPIAEELRSRGPRRVILKLGDQGCFASDESTAVHYPGFPVEAVDATAAGDTFNAGLAVGLSEGLSFAHAIRMANAAAAISVTRRGAQSSAPSRAEVDALLGLQTGR